MLCFKVMDTVNILRVLFGLATFAWFIRPKVMHLHSAGPPANGVEIGGIEMNGVKRVLINPDILSLYSPGIYINYFLV